MSAVTQNVLCWLSYRGLRSYNRLPQCKDCDLYVSFVILKGLQTSFHCTTWCCILINKQPCTLYLVNSELEVYIKPTVVFLCCFPWHTVCLVCPQVIQKDLEDCEAHITALETLVSSNQSNRPQFDRLFADWKHLYKAVRVRGDSVLKWMKV